MFKHTIIYYVQNYSQVYNTMVNYFFLKLQVKKKKPKGFVANIFISICFAIFIAIR